MDEIVGLLFMLFAYLGGVDIRIVDVPLIAYETDGRAHETNAKVTACLDGHAHIEALDGVLDAPQNLAHEALHLADCRDDGIYNGSPLPYPPTAADPAHEWVYFALNNPDTAAQIIERLSR